MKNKKMKKKILEVTGSGKRLCYQMGYGDFQTTHTKQDIEKWLKHFGRYGCMSSSTFERVFNLNPYDWEVDIEDEDVENYDFDFNESDLNEEVITEDETKNLCKFDDEIQTFLDEEKQKDILKLKEELKILQSPIN